MPNLAAVMKEEVLRLSRKEIRNELAPLRKTVSSLRQEVQGLKRDRAALQKELARLAKVASAVNPEPAEADELSHAFMRPAGIKTLRKRLGLSAEQMGLLTGASGQSVYNWEGGVRPRKAQMGKLVELRSLGKREVASRLEELSAASTDRTVKKGKR